MLINRLLPYLLIPLLGGILSTVLYAAPNNFQENHAIPHYVACSPGQKAEIIAGHQLLSKETLEHAEPDQRADCILLDTAYSLIVTANADSPDNNLYQIKLYLFDQKNNLIINQYTLPKMFNEENGALSSIQFDHSVFSNLANTHVIGVNTLQYNFGHASYEKKVLNLFQINLQPTSSSNPNTPSNDQIQWVLKGLVNRFESNWRPSYGCDIGTHEEIRSIFILQPSQQHGLQDILLKQSQKIEDSDERCKVSREQHQSQQLLKFDGHQYRINQAQLLKSEDFSGIIKDGF